MCDSPLWVRGFLWSLCLSVLVDASWAGTDLSVWIHHPGRDALLSSSKPSLIIGNLRETCEGCSCPGWDALLSTSLPPLMIGIFTILRDTCEGCSCEGCEGVIFLAVGFGVRMFDCILQSCLVYRTHMLWCLLVVGVACFACRPKPGYLDHNGMGRCWPQSLM